MADNPIELLELEAAQSVDHLSVAPSATDEASIAGSSLYQDEAETKAKLISALPPVDRGWHAWLFALNAFILETMIWGWSITFGIVQVYLHTHPPFNSASLAAITAVGTVATAFQYILPLFILIFFQKYPEKVKPILWIAVGVSTGSMLLSSWATQVWQLILLQGIIGGSSGAILYTPVVLWLQEWFVERRGVVSGIIFAGTGVGGFVFPFLVGALLDKTGFRWTCRIWSLLTLIAFGTSVATMNPRIPVTRRKGEARRHALPSSLRFTYSPLVLVMCLTTFMSSMSYFPVAVYIPNYTTALATPLSANIVLAIYNVASVTGRIGIGWLSDRYSYALIIIVTGIICSITAFVTWGFADTLPKVFGFAVLFGSFSGISSVFSAVSKDVGGDDSQKVTLAYCMFLVSRGSAAVLGPLVATALYNEDSTSKSSSWGRYGFQGITIFVGSMAVVSAMGGAGLAAARRSKKNQ